MGMKRVPDHFITMLSRVRRLQLWLFKLNFIATQGTKVLEDREIRLDFCWTSVDTPPRLVFPKVAKYTGPLVAPEWEDAEKGRAFNFPWCTL